MVVVLVTLVLHLAKTVTVPIDSTLIVLGKDAPIYLEEGDKIQALASAAGDLEIIISYEELDDIGGPKNGKMVQTVEFMETLN